MGRTILALVVGALGGIGVAPGAAENWVSEGAVGGSGLQQLSDVAVDAAGVPHVVLEDNGELAYAHRTGGTWTVEHPAPGVDLRVCSIVLGAAGDVHIAFTENASPAPLYYARKSGGSWTIETVGVEAGTDIQIALDSSGAPWIVYSDQVTPCCDWELYVSAKTGATWDQWIVDHTTTRIEHPSIAIDLVGPGLDFAHVAYEIVENGGPGSRLWHSGGSGVTWSPRVAIDIVGLGAGVNQIALDSQGTPHVAYSYGHPFGGVNGVWYATETAPGTWSFEEIESSVDFVSGPSLVMDSLDDPHVAYSYSGAAEPLYHATKSGGIWSSEVADAGGPGGSGSRPSIALGSDGVFHITHETKGLNRNLRHAWSTSSSAAPIDVAVPGRAPVRFESAAPNPFRLGARLTYSVAGEGPVRVRIFDARGRQVRTLADRAVAAGVHDLVWDGRGEAGETVAPGVYFVRIEALGTSDSRKLARVR